MSKRNIGGNATRAEDGPTANDEFSLISNEKLIALYTNLVKCRMIEQAHSAAFQVQRRTNGHRPAMRTCEAALVAGAIDLGSDDAAFLSDRLLRGFTGLAPIEALLSPANNGQEKAFSDSLHAPMGVALANKTKKNGKIVVVFAGNEPSQDWNDAVQSASVHLLPMIFLTQVDGKPPARSRSAALAEPASFPSITVDRDDVVAVYRVASEAISRARQGRGPTLIECRPFRLSGSAPVNQYTHGNYRHVHDPILNMENYLRSKGLFPSKLKADTLEAVTRQVDAAMKAPKGVTTRPSVFQARRP